MASSPAGGFGPRTLIGRLLLAIGAILLLGNATVIWQMYGWERENVEQSERARLQAIAALLVRQIDVEQHETAAAEHPIEDHFTRWENAGPAARSLHAILDDAATDLGLETPVYTVYLPEDSKVTVASEPREVHENALEILVSSDAPRWRHPYAFRPEMLDTLLHGRRGATGIYKSDGLALLSVYEPLLNAEGAVAGMLVVDAPPEALLDRIQQKFLREMAFMGATFAAVFIAVALITKRMSRELAAIEKAAVKLGEGDFDTPIHASGVNEVITLARGLEMSRRQIARRMKQFNALIEDLRHKLSAAKLQLDPRVLERRERIAEATGRVVASMVLGLGEQKPCALVDLGYTDAVVRVPDDREIDLAPGMPATLNVGIEGDPMLSLEVVTHLRLNHEDHIEYRVNLLEPLDNRHDLPQGLSSLLNTRGTFRVRPGNHAPVLVDMQEADGAFLVADAAVENVSLTGLAVRVPQAPMIVATWGTDLRIHVTLPGHVVPIEFAVRVRNVAEAMGGSRLGLAFDVNEPGFKQKQEHVTDYVMDRQREMKHAGMTMAS